MLIKETTKTRRSGNTITITGELLTSGTKTVFADGWNAEVSSKPEINIDISVEGFGSQGDWVRELSDNDRKLMGLSAIYVAKVGDLPLEVHQVALIDSVISTLENTPEWKELEASKARARAASLEYENGLAEVEALMNE